MENPKLKTAKDVREEITQQYFTLGKRDLRGNAPFFSVREAYNEIQRMEAVKSDEIVLKEVVMKYFKPTQGGKYEDGAGNIYADEKEAFELGIMCDFFNNMELTSRRLKGAKHG